MIHEASLIQKGWNKSKEQKASSSESKDSQGTSRYEQVSTQVGPGSCGMMVSQAVGDIEEGNSECEALERLSRRISVHYRNKDTLKNTVEGNGHRDKTLAPKSRRKEDGGLSGVNRRS